jgi:riboflavin kinase, archaea type
LSKIVFEGTVFSGTGNGKEFVNLPWVKRQIEEKLVFTPYAGTLNIRLTEDSAQKKSLLEKVQGIKIEPQVGYCQGALFRACIDALNCAVVIPKVPNYPSDVLEVIASVYLRGELKLVDGCMVTVTVNV